jgi:hypothetical protein
VRALICVLVVHFFLLFFAEINRLNPHQRMSFLGLFPFTAPYLPWVLLGFSVLLGNPVTIDLVGIAVSE